MDRTAKLLQARSRSDSDVMRVRVGTIVAVNPDSTLQVTLAGATLTIPGDRRFPKPSLGPVVLGYAAGQYSVLACPQAPQSFHL